MNQYHAFIDAQERTYMTEDEKLEKRNSEILMSYRATGDNIIPENKTAKSESVNVKPERSKNSRN